AHALESGGWFAESHESQVAKAASIADEAERLTAVRTLLAEETRIGMMVGVAVGWALRQELVETEDEEERSHGHPLHRPRDVRALRRLDDRARGPVPGPEQPGGDERAGRRQPERDRRDPRPR